MKSVFLFLLSFSLININICSSQTGWTVQNSGTSYLLNAVYFFDLNTGFAAGGNPSGCIILKTTNGGNSWAVNYQSTANVNIKCLKFLNSNTGFAVGGYYPISVIMKTTNQGLTWVNQNTTISGSMYVISFVDTNVMYVASDYGRILKTTNSGTNWNVLQTPVTDLFECVQFVNSATGFAVGRAGTIVQTTNSGNNWFVSFNCGTWLNSVSFINANTGYAVGQNGKMLFTNNGGVNWTLQSSGTNNILNEVLFINQSTGFVMGASGLIYKSINTGSSWDTQASGVSADLYSAFFVNDNTGYVCGDNGTILKTTSGGNTLVVPVLVYPPNNTTNIPLTPALTWTANPPALYYKVQVSRLSDFSTIVDSATVTTTQRLIPAGKLITGTTYFWRVNATNEYGAGPWSTVWNFGTVPVGINQISSEVPDKYYLYNNYPNPFNPGTLIKYQVPEAGYVSLKIYNSLGREVETLVDAKQAPGTYAATFDGSKFASGIYFYRLETEKYSSTKKMFLIK